MKLLAVDTATPASSVAIGDGQHLEAMAVRVDRRGHVGFVVGALDFCFERAGWSAYELDAVVVDIGPGLFTGIRAGLATAQGVAAAAGVPLVPVTSLDAIAFRAATGRRQIWSVVDVRKGQVAVAAYRPLPGGVVRETAIELVTPDELRALIDSEARDTLVVGDWEALPEATLRGLHRVKTGSPRHPSADVLLELAALRISRGDVPDSGTVRPLYLRAPDAAIGWDDFREEGMWPDSRARVRIRPMVPADLDTVTRLEAGIYPQPWSDAVFAEELVREGRLYLAAEEDGEIVGYAGLMTVEDEAHVTTVAVSPGARQRGVGKRLMLELVEAALTAGARHLTLEVRVSNAPARDLYQRFGFAPVGLRKNYYRDEDALIMWAIDVDDPSYRERLDGIRREVEDG